MDKNQKDLYDFIHHYEFYEIDRCVLAKLKIEKVRKAIDCLKVCNDISWLDHDTGAIIPNSEMENHKFHLQPEPIYPTEIESLASHFCRIYDIVREKFPEEHESLMSTLKNADTLDPLFNSMTMLSPWVFIGIFAWFVSFDAIWDGWIGYEIRNNMFLKGLLHLEDAWKCYKSTKTRRNHE